jgi:hypothetical protein
MIKFFLALLGLAAVTLVGTFVLAGLTMQAGQLVALRPVSTSVEIRGPPVLSTHSVLVKKQRGPDSDLRTPLSLGDLSGHSAN